MLVSNNFLSIGDKVRYQPDDDFSYEFQNGIVKEIPKHTKDTVRIVYSCAQDWENYKDYTSELTRINGLKYGWKNDKSKT